MKILIVTYSYPPANSPAAHRPYFMAKYLCDMGHQITVLTSSNAISSLGKSNWAKSLPNVAIWDTAKNGFVEQERVNDTKTTISVWVNSGKLSWFKKIARFFIIPDRGIVWLKELVKFDSRKIGPVDVVYSTSPLFTNHLVARRLAKKKKAKWVVDIRDFHHINGDMEQKKGMRSMINSMMQMNVLKRADYVTFVTKSMHEVYKNRYHFLDAKSSVIYNGYEPDEYPAAELHLESDVLKIFYAGSFYDGARDPAPLFAMLDALHEKKLINLDAIRVEVAGNIPDLIKDIIKRYKSSVCVNYLGLVDRKTALDKMTNAHLLWLIVANIKAHYMTFPVKGFEYVGCKRHILLFSPPEAEAKTIVEYLDAGTFFNLSVKEEEIAINAEKFLHLYNKFKTNELSAPLTLDTAKVQLYLRQGQASQLHNIFQTICHT
ncbi:MAG: glycosyltransferase [Chitinophagaceae bacterium]|nr:glycosyltransferase [Chitinophagaceae bacterium]